jgi:hypothetical protein
VPFEIDAGVFGPIADACRLGAKLAVIEHFFDVAQAVGPTAEVFARDRPAPRFRAAATAGLQEPLDAAAPILAAASLGTTLATTQRRTLAVLVVARRLPAVTAALVVTLIGLVLSVGILAPSALASLALAILLVVTALTLLVLLR